ncbi:FliC/FljB family flagellin [Collimonas sp.]|jgi:flagellin|uniref:FliC/FljB family flagellin n=1 Tax=Collimonas sp. TaxID=1963772 RepID=UPI002CEB669C|nr:FliC/FljB family flagellin [Collimonas sp.]HWW08201.1 FliC/FljB family flagellin [Collimonas sp.]
MSVINTNILSLVAQNNLTKSAASLSSAIQRLSSGMRINSAKDDAAGQAIANRFTANITGLTQASRNANDGISLAQTTEGALTEVNNNLQRIRELSVQAASGTNSSSDLQSIQDEVGQRLKEIDRISSQTDFNGVKVLATNQTLNIQVGANDGQTIGIGLQKIDSTALKLNTLNLAGPTGATATLTPTGKDNTGAATAVTAGGFTAVNRDPAAGFTAAVTDLVTDARGNTYVKNGANFYAATVTVADATQGGTAAAPTATVTYDSSKALTAASSSPLTAMDSALSQVDSLRSSLGAVQNRFASTIANLGTTVTNLSSSRSGIQDADYATEVSNMTRSQILQQAGTSVLAKANQSTQSVLTLLQ